MKKILIVDDHEIVLKGMSQMLGSAGYEVVGVTGASQALMVLNHVRDISLAVCDLSLPAVTEGIAFIEQLNAISPKMPVIVFTMHEELWNIRTLMELGVSGVVLKGENPKELLCAVDAVLKGKEYFSKLFCKMRDELISTDGILTKKEIEVIRRISSGDKTKDIALRLGLSEKTIEFHRTSILRKLGVKSIAEATRRACEMGLLIVMLLLFALMPAQAEDYIDVYCNNGTHYTLPDNGTVVEFEKDDVGEWTAVITIDADSTVCLLVSLIDSIAINHPLVTKGDAIDMGTGVLWSSRNVGASQPEEFGAFYAFGETEEKDFYDYSNYSFCAPDDKWLMNVYPIDSNISSTELDPSHVHWADGWRLPTLDESLELIQKCTSKVLTYNGVKGMLVIAANGNTIFLPLGGTKRATSTHQPTHLHIGKEGIFMTATSEQDTGEEDGEHYSLLTAYGFYADAGGTFGEVLLNPVFGINVRPVKNNDD